MFLLSTLHISHVIVESESLLLTLSMKMFARNPCYESPSIYPRAERRHCSTVFIFNFEHISHLVLVPLLLMLRMYLIGGFDISYFSRF